MNSSDYYRERLTENMTDSLNVEYELTYAEKRKATPVFSGVLMYFPDAINTVARCSQAGQQQHAPDEPLKWHREKSGDELDALSRHLLQAGTMDTDGIRHSAKVAWRALANLQKELEESGDAPLSQYNVTKQ
tara:strand:+ start:897 stop:1292 length:396 start_codon:yes stop_codon:yes gene_type:complete